MKASNCKHETSNGRCGLKGCYAYRHKCFTEDLCKCHEPMTNADRIRAMSDEELAEWIVTTGTICDCCIMQTACADDIRYEDCKNNVTKWLQQPCEAVQPIKERPDGQS